MPLDIPTLLMATAMVVAFSGGLLIILHGSKAWNALSLWGLAMLVGAAALGLIAAEPVVPSAISFNVGHAMLLFAPGLSWTAARAFERRKPVFWLLLGGPGLWLLASCMTQPEQSGSLMTLIYPMAAAYTFATAWELWRGRSETLPARPLAFGLLFFHAGLYLACTGARVLLHRPGLSGPATEAIQVFVILEGMLHTIGMAFVLFAMATERAELQATSALRELALSDALTGLANRRQFDETLELELRRATRDRTPLTLLMIDVDYFKSFNDLYGHPMGDSALRELGQAVQSVVQRPGDLVARYGGEELAVLLPRTDEPGALAVAEHICAAVRALNIEHREVASGRVTISVGAAALVPEPGEQCAAEMLLSAADEALYGAKAAGRDTIGLAGPIPPAGSRRSGTGGDTLQPPPPS